MKQKNKMSEVVVIDLTLEDETNTKSQLRLKSKTKNESRKRKIGLKENSDKFLKRDNTWTDFNVQISKEHKLHNFHNFEIMNLATATAAAHQYTEELLHGRTDIIQDLHNALDVNHTHFPCGDRTDWDNLPQGFRTHFASSKFKYYFYSDYFIGVRLQVAGVSDAVVIAMYYGTKSNHNLDIQYFQTINRIAPINTVFELFPSIFHSLL